jgi:hypothetical protein
MPLETVTRTLIKTVTEVTGLCVYNNDLYNIITRGALKFPIYLIRV